MAAGADSPSRAALQAAVLEQGESLGVEGGPKRAKLTGTKPAAVRASDNHVSRKRKSENVTEHGPEESAPMAPVTEDAAAQEGPKRPPKASKDDEDDDAWLQEYKRELGVA
eukprot:jgi/Astpho2/8877/Aster-05507